MADHVVRAEVKDLECTPPFDFVTALYKLKRGAKAARDDWSSNGMWIALIPADQWAMGSRQPYDTGAIGSRYLPWIGMKSTDGAFVPWACSQTDLLAEDWHIVE